MTDEKLKEIRKIAQKSLKENSDNMGSQELYELHLEDKVLLFSIDKNNGDRDVQIERINRITKDDLVDSGIINRKIGSVGVFVFDVKLGFFARLAQNPGCFFLDHPSKNLLI